MFLNILEHSKFLKRYYITEPKKDILKNGLPMLNFHFEHFIYEVSNLARII